MITIESEKDGESIWEKHNPSWLVQAISNPGGMLDSKPDRIPSKEEVRKSAQHFKKLAISLF
jgi:hypothetical protein